MVLGLENPSCKLERIAGATASDTIIVTDKEVQANVAFISA
jgi:hypothetical protein